MQTIDDFIPELKASPVEGDSRLPPRTVQKKLDKLRDAIIGLSCEARLHIVDYIESDLSIDQDLDDILSAIETEQYDRLDNVCF